MRPWTMTLAIAGSSKVTRNQTGVAFRDHSTSAHELFCRELSEASDRLLASWLRSRRSGPSRAQMQRRKLVANRRRFLRCAGRTSLSIVTNDCHKRRLQRRSLGLSTVVVTNDCHIMAVFIVHLYRDSWMTLMVNSNPTFE